jgi:drug/metabolite transporter (DMT)-like permease
VGAPSTSPAPGGSPPPPPRHTNPILLYTGVVVLLLLWTMNYLVAKEGFQRMPPLTLAIFRVDLATFLLLPLFFIERMRGPRRRPRGKEILYLAMLGVLGICLNQIFFTVGLNYTTVAHSSLIVCIGPVNVLLLAWMMGMERLTAPKIVGISIAFAGVAILAFGQGSTSRAPTLRGDLMTLGASLAFTGYTVLGKRVAGRFSPVTINVYSYSAAALLLAPLTLRQGLRLNWQAVGWEGWWDVVYMALGTSVFAYLLWFWALRHLAASRLSVFTYLQPVLGTLLGIYVLHEPFTRQTALAGGLVLGGVLLTEWHPRWLADDEDESLEEPAPN